MLKALYNSRMKAERALIMASTKIKEKVSEIGNKRTSGEGHLVAVIIVIVIVIGLAIIFRDRVETWFNNVMTSMENETTSAFTGAGGTP